LPSFEILIEPNPMVRKFDFIDKCVQKMVDLVKQRFFWTRDNAIQKYVFLSIVIPGGEIQAHQSNSTKINVFLVAVVRIEPVNKQAED
jgi:hypothetical protein